jgi:hypothetical protein
MKGVVFTEFIEFVEESFGFDAVDAMVEDSGLSGVYTQAGNYPFEEMVALIVALSKAQGVEVNELLEKYGKHLFGRLAGLYPNINRFSSALDVISHVDNIIHPEVHKLYPEAELPSFKVIEKNSNKLVLEYTSGKSLQHLAKGLMLGAAKFYNEDLEVNIDEEKKPVVIEVLRK